MKVSKSEKKKVKQKLHDEQLKKLDVEKVRIYFHNLPIIGNVFTACLFLDKDNNILSRGVAIRSPIDPFKKSEGRKWAYKRAMRAIYKKSNDFPINAYLLRWDHQILKREFKVKTDNDERLMFDKVLPTLDMIKGQYCDASLVTTLRTKVVDDKHEKIEQKTIKYDLPRDTMLFLTSEIFDYKSCYKPEPTKYEVELLKPVGR